MKTPYLVQRCKTRYQMNASSIMGSFIGYDYMGSSAHVPRELTGKDYSDYV